MNHFGGNNAQTLFFKAAEYFPTRLRRTPSGLMIENVCSKAIFSFLSRFNIVRDNSSD